MRCKGMPVHGGAVDHVMRAAHERRGGQSGRGGRGRGGEPRAKQSEGPFAEASWTEEHATYIHDDITFTGDQPGHTHPFRDFPSPALIFERFFSERTLRKSALSLIDMLGC